MPIEITFSSIEKKYGGRSLYHNLSGHILPGQCTCLTGSNGSGKSTFLKIIAGLLRPSGGKICYLENGCEQPAEAVREQIASAAPDMQLYGNLTAGENLLFFASMSSIHLSAGEVLSILGQVGLAGAEEKTVHSFSTGMKQKLKLGLLLATKRTIWLLDEPSSNLDAAGRETVRKLIEAGKEKQYTIVLATNDPMEEAYGDAIIHIS